VLTDAITVRLRLPGLVVLGAQEWGDHIEIVARYGNEEAPCPGCRRSTWQVHQWHGQRKRDAKLWGKPVWVLVWKRRFRCRRCGKVFMETDPACGRCRRTTRRLRRTVAQRADDATVRSVAHEERVSEGLVQRSWLEERAIIASAQRPHVFLGLDGFCARRLSRMWTGLWDLETRNPVAVVPGERQGDVQTMLERYAPRDTVRAVVMDLSEAYRQAVQLVLPDAACVADKFHVLALAGRALREVRGGRRQRGNVAWLLHRGVERLNDAECRRLVAALEADPALAKAWALKEGLRSVYRCSTEAEAQAVLGAWVCDAQGSGLPPFVRAASTLRRWRREVLNYWRHPLTNAVVEGKHNRVKVLKRRAYGYRNDRTFLLRILNLVHTD